MNIAVSLIVCILILFVCKFFFQVKVYFILNKDRRKLYDEVDFANFHWDFSYLKIYKNLSQEDVETIFLICRKMAKK